MWRALSAAFSITVSTALCAEWFHAGAATPWHLRLAAVALLVTSVGSLIDDYSRANRRRSAMERDLRACRGALAGAKAWSVTISAIGSPPRRYSSSVQRALDDHASSTGEGERPPSEATSYVKALWNGDRREAGVAHRRSTLDRLQARSRRAGQLSVLREVRRITGMDLVEAREALAGLPLVVATTDAADEARALVDRLERSGAVVAASEVRGVASCAG